MKRADCDVAIIGAGVAGLAAAATLARAGKSVLCLEATNRVGGRVWTIHDLLAPLAIELGAEFVHGRPPEIWDLIRASSLTAYEHTSRALHIDRDRTFRLGAGYDSVAMALLRSILNPAPVVRLNSVVERVKWRRGMVAVQTSTGEVRCRKLIVTASLGVLQAGAIQFEPAPEPILKAAQALEFGRVYRVTFRFRDAFWESDKRFQRAGFLISTDKQFFTWWTAHPIAAPLLTAWCAGSAADQFLTAAPAEVQSPRSARWRG